MKRWLTFGLLVGLLAGCRSERVAVRLPAAAITVPPRPVAPPAETGATSEAKSSLPLPAPDPAAPPLIRAPPPSQDKPAHWPFHELARKQVAKPAPAPIAQLKASERTGWDWGSILQAIGTGLFVGGLVLGIVVGGWAGFGLFLLGSVVGLFVAFCGSFLIDGQM
ncbi:hypothetical protein [Hymenobacter rubripertinctus]|uniref:Uncharacterized protein n=1 Tax=Hymenobacter rubripertinctus TaxID=2029981 RepID=A0A418R664_9BACT|nr:hypothetical protein [Hymenobacter rubripertinctus]RIY12957.1 hypothetical protein D0T11_04310 [Hymenobacter rubripertinctus]